MSVKKNIKIYQRIPTSFCRDKKCTTKGCIQAYSKNDNYLFIDGRIAHDIKCMEALETQRNDYHLVVFFPQTKPAGIIIENREYCVKPGEYLIMNIDQSAGFKLLNSRYKDKVRELNISKTLLLDLLKGNLKIDISKLNFDNRPQKVIPIIKSALNVLSDSFKESEKSNDPVLLESAVLHLVNVLLNKHPVNTKLYNTMIYDANPNKFRIQKVIDFIEENACNSFTLNDLSLISGLNKYLLIRFFKKFTGVTPWEYLHKAKIDRAKELLAKSDKNITEVCYDTGFNNLSYFERLFFKYTKLTPLEFRKKIKQ